MLSLGRARIGGALDQLQAFGFGPAVEQDGAQPGIRVGVRRTEGAQRPFGSGRIALAIRDDGRPQRGRYVGSVGWLLGVRGGAGGDERRGEHRSRHGHFVLKV